MTGLPEAPSTGGSSTRRSPLRNSPLASQQRPVTLSYRGKSVAGQEFTITPYLDDPNRPRFEQLANKRYVFTLSDAVPGGVYGIRALVVDAVKGADAPPLLAEELLIDGAPATPKQ